MITNSKGRGGAATNHLSRWPLIGRRRWQVNGAIRITQPGAMPTPKPVSLPRQNSRRAEATVREAVIGAKKIKRAESERGSHKFMATFNCQVYVTAAEDRPIFA